MDATGFQRLGLAVYDQVPSNQALEPLFRFANREVLGMKFVDMLGTIVDNIHSPDFIFKKIAELAPMHHRLGMFVCKTCVCVGGGVCVYMYCLHDMCV